MVESIISGEVQRLLIKQIDEKTEQALKEDNTEMVKQLSHAKKLIKRGYWTVRKANPYTAFLETCLSGKKEGLEESQQKMKQCAEEWRNQPKKDKPNEKLNVIDYLKKERSG